MYDCICRYKSNNAVIMYLVYSQYGAPLASSNLQRNVNTDVRNDEWAV